MSTAPDTRIQAITGRSGCHECEIYPENKLLAPISPDEQRILPEERALCFSPSNRLTVPCCDTVFLAVAVLADSLLAMHLDTSWVTERELRRDGIAAMRQASAQIPRSNDVTRTVTQDEDPT